MNSIPVDQLQSKTSTGLQIKVFRASDEHENIKEVAHRDDHYLFFLLKSGLGALNIDSQDVVITGKQLYYILPSQVHYRVKTNGAEGWFIAVDTSLIEPHFKDVFERRPSLQLPVNLTGYELKQYSNLLKLLYGEYNERRDDKYYLPIIHSLVQSFLAMAASTYNSVETIEGILTRSAELARQFKTLLAAHYRSIKSPSEYAAKLNVSSGYLNEAVKKVTGSTVSYWIGQEIFSEAKRLLNHTDADVKQIAHELGYTDYAYFIRSFRKIAGMSPLGFRKLRT